MYIGYIFNFSYKITILCTDDEIKSKKLSKHIFKYLVFISKLNVRLCSESNVTSTEINILYDFT